MTEVVFNFEEGEFFEGGDIKSAGFEIHLNQKVYCHCRHCHSEQIKTDQTAIDPKITFESRSYICPAVVVAYNEGGQNATGVCLHCILEAKETLPKV